MCCPGRFYAYFRAIFTASIAVSALVSLTLAPMLCSRFMHKESGNHGRVYRIPALAEHACARLGGERVTGGDSASHSRESSHDPTNG